MTPRPGRALATGYPSRSADRDAWVVARRGARPAHDPWHHQGVTVEPERSADGQVVDVATVFLTGRECPWRCVMCDLWRHTTAADTPGGAIPTQIQRARTALQARASAPSHVKLYNAGSFFDRRAVPPEDDPAIVEALHGMSHVIVESHPALIGDRTWRFQEALTSRQHGSLEVAMGLETAHPGALAALNKRITVEGFARAATRLAAHGVALRVFLLLHPPWIPAHEQRTWLRRSVTTAFECGASVVALVPTRSGEGALSAIATRAGFLPATLPDVEASVAAVLPAARGRVFVDLWDFDRLASCSACATARRARLNRLNLDQMVPPPFTCTVCGDAPAA